MAKLKFNSLTGLFDLVEDRDSLGLDTTDSPTFNDLMVTETFGCNGATPQTAYVSGGEKSGTPTSGLLAYGFVSEAEMNDFITMCKNIRAALVANGIMS